MTHHDGRARQELTTPKKFICILVVASVVFLIATAHDMNRDSCALFLLLGFNPKPGVLHKL